MFRVLLVDDENTALNRLSRIIAQDKDFEIVGKELDSERAFERVQELKADVVFLDVEMGKVSGLEVAVQLNKLENPPIVVFATAYEDYAVAAFEANALDYVLKPFVEERILKALERIKATKRSAPEIREHLSGLEKTLVEKGMLRKIVGYARDSKDKFIVAPEAVNYFEAREKEVIAYTDDLEVIVKMSLKQLCELLEGHGFTQTHRAYLVNLDKIKKLSPLFRGNYALILSDPKQSKIPLARNQVERLKKLFGSW